MELLHSEARQRRHWQVVVQGEDFNIHVILNQERSQELIKAEFGSISNTKISNPIINLKLTETTKLRNWFVVVQKEDSLIDPRYQTKKTSLQDIIKATFDLYEQYRKTNKLTNQWSGWSEELYVGGATVLILSRAARQNVIANPPNPFMNSHSRSLLLATRRAFLSHWQQEHEACLQRLKTIACERLVLSSGWSFTHPLAVLNEQACKHHSSPLSEAPRKTTRHWLATRPRLIPFDNTDVN